MEVRMNKTINPPVNYIQADIENNTMIVIVEVCRSVVPHVEESERPIILQNTHDDEGPVLKIVMFESGRKVHLVDKEDDLEVILDRYPSEDDPNKLSFYAFVKYTIVE